MGEQKVVPTQGQEFTFVSASGTEFTAFVAQIDESKGMTLQALDPELPEVQDHIRSIARPDCWCMNFDRCATGSIEKEKEAFYYACSCICQGRLDVLHMAKKFLWSREDIDGKDLSELASTGNTVNCAFIGGN